MMQQSPFMLIRSLERLVSGHLAAIDIQSLAPTDQAAVTRLRSELTDTRLTIRDYELSETRDEQVQNAAEAKEQIAAIDRHIVALSQASSLLGAADVAQYSAQLQIISALLR